MKGSSTSAPPDRAGLRRLLLAVLPTDSDLDAYCLDYFPDTKRKFAGGMDRIQKLNLLFEAEDAQEIVQAVQRQEPERFKRNAHLIAEGDVKPGDPAKPAPVRVQQEAPPVAVTPSPQVQRAASSPTQPSADVVIITALKEEYDAARLVNDGALGDWTVDRSVTGNELAFRDYETAGGAVLRIAMTWATRMRGVSVAAVAPTLLDRLGARGLAMCGVCAGRRGKVQLGDVIIAKVVYSINMGALQIERDVQVVEHRRFQADPDPFPLSDALLHRAQNFGVDGAPWISERPLTLEAQGNWLLSQLVSNSDPMTHAESTQRCPDWGESIERLERLKLATIDGSQLRITEQGKAHIGPLLFKNRNQLPRTPAFSLHRAPIATGPDVMRDPGLFGKLADSMRDVLGVDMEAAAMGQIGHMRGLPWVVMKGVMDHADGDKDDRFKPFAARASAECLIRFLRENPPGERAKQAPAAGREAGSGPATAQEARLAGAAPSAAGTAAGGGSIKATPRPAGTSSDGIPLPKKLEAVLRRSPALVRALQAHGYAQATALGADVAAAIATELTQRYSRALLDDLSLACRREASLKPSVRELLVHVLPLACDWQDTVRRAEAAAKEGRPIPLSVRTMTLAEVINAGIDQRDCRFALSTEFDMSGAAHVPLPAVAYAPVFDLRGKHIAENVLSNLGREQQPAGSAGAHEDWLPLRRSATTDSEFMSAAQHQINKPTRMLNRYLLFIDAKLAKEKQGYEETDFDQRWEVICDALKESLPGLRLLRLKGRDEAWDREHPLISDIRDLHTL